MTTVRIVTDSACDLSEAEATEHRIEVVPLTIRFGDREYVDRDELSVSQFYELMAAEDVLPQTAAPAPGAFGDRFAKLLDEGAEAVICINLSSALSATMQSAQTAAKDFNGAVHVVDSTSITGGLGTIAMNAAIAAEAGASAEDVVALATRQGEQTQLYGILDTLENLKKGGRIGNAQAMLGTMLSIKPLLDLSSGAVEEAGRQRTRKKAMAWLRDKLLEQETIEGLNILHGDAPDIDQFLEMLTPHFDLAEVRIGKIGPVIGSHGGPRVLGVSFRTP